MEVIGQLYVQIAFRHKKNSQYSLNGRRDELVWTWRGMLPLPRLEPKIFQSAEQSLYRTPDTGPHGQLHESRGILEDTLFLWGLGWRSG
jgi:hypothetical protein